VKSKSIQIRSRDPFLCAVSPSPFRSKSPRQVLRSKIIVPSTVHSVLTKVSIVGCQYLLLYFSVVLRTSFPMAPGTRHVHVHFLAPESAGSSSFLVLIRKVNSPMPSMYIYDSPSMPLRHKVDQCCWFFLVYLSE